MHKTWSLEAKVHIRKAIPLCDPIIMNTWIFLGYRHDCYFYLDISFNLNFYQVSVVKPLQHLVVSWTDVRWDL